MGHGIVLIDKVFMMDPMFKIDIVIYIFTALYFSSPLGLNLSLSFQSLQLDGLREKRSREKERKIILLIRGYTVLTLPLNLYCPSATDNDSLQNKF